jgi:hypothetical protein
MKQTKQQEHGTSRYDYGTGKVSAGGKKPESKGPEMGRKVMPGDAHASMKSGKC